jgi:hypothetical protein
MMFEIVRGVELGYVAEFASGIPAAQNRQNPYSPQGLTDAAKGPTVIVLSIAGISSDWQLP